MKFAAAALTLLPLAIALPTTERAAPPTNTARGFTLIAARSGSPIHLQPVAANGLGLWIGASTSSYCPSPPVTDCADYTNSTVLACGDDAGGETGCSMSVAVPGGQALYVDAATGDLAYTVAHSADQPPGAIDSGFTYTRSRDPSEFGDFSFCAQGAQGLLACSANGDACDLESGRGCAPWRVVAALPGVDSANCLGFDALAYGTNATAWEYA